MRGSVEGKGGDLKMSLWLNNKEKSYLEWLVQEDLDIDPEFTTRILRITIEEREKLLGKIKDCKV